MPQATFKHLTDISKTGIATLEQRDIHDSDHVSAICSAFFIRQVEYAAVVDILLEGGQIAGAALVVRSMVEGAACLWWVMNSEHALERAFNWRKHVYHESLKIPDGYEESNRGTSNIYEVKAEAQRLMDEGQAFKESRWTVDERGKRVSARRIIEEFLGSDGSTELHLHRYYQLLSAFAHWSPAAFTTDNSDPEKWRNARFPEFFGQTCESLAFLSLYHIVALTDKHFRLSIL